MQTPESLRKQVLALSPLPDKLRLNVAEMILDVQNFFDHHLSILDGNGSDRMKQPYHDRIEQAIELIRKKQDVKPLVDETKKDFKEHGQEIDIQISDKPTSGNVSAQTKEEPKEDIIPKESEQVEHPDDKEELDFGSLKNYEPIGFKPNTNFENEPKEEVEKRPEIESTASVGRIHNESMESKSEDNGLDEDRQSGKSGSAAEEDDGQHSLF